MWSLDYVQVPVEDDPQSKRVAINQNTKSEDEDKPSHHRLVKQIHVSNENSRTLMKSGSESSLSGGDLIPKTKVKFQNRSLYRIVNLQQLLRSKWW